ncbi:formimidoylglutamase [Corynebacterium tapiri]|uniref:Formimidoylglutamase n=1 Tax=Corynebacterium tapiri TaxID=1448266 RepID=A0A5C4U4K7_9CORY|nr:formimidoylglutamase [Corynebacterium tapiri]TNL96806.1 formimidoylglutamase [Corynebacterium tapiri]
MTSLYSPAPDWSGRSDGPGPEHARWHSVIRPDDGHATNAVALLGFSSDEGVRRNHGRPGAAAGPEALRSALGSLAVHSDISLVDAGTVTTPGTDLESGQAELSARVSDLAQRNNLVVVLGGGHETAFASHRGLYQARGAAGIVNIDAHFDLREADEPTSGTPFRNIADLVGEDFDYTVLGISEPNNTAALFATAEQLGTTVVLDHELLAQSPAECAQRATDACQGDRPIHLSIDLDVLPAAVAPGVSAPAGLGVDLDRVRAIALAVAATGRLALVDVVELNPEFDVDSRTAKVAARLIHDVVTTAWQAQNSSPN